MTLRTPLIFCAVTVLVACSGGQVEVDDSGDVLPPASDAGITDDGGVVADAGFLDQDAGEEDDEGPGEDEEDGGYVEEPEPDAGEVDPEPHDGGTPKPRFWWSTEIFNPADSPNPIWGDGHVHSNFSGDGTYPALEMMNRAKQLGADFIWITDHGKTPADSGGLKATEFDVCADKGAQASGANYFAACGVEYRLGYTRPDGSKKYQAWHQVVHGMAKDEFGELLNENGYTNWKAYQDDLAATNTVYATLTHPAGPTAWYNDNDSQYRDSNPANHPNVELCELNGGDDNAANGNNMVDGINIYLRFLNDGWQVSPVWNSDMHGFYRGDEQAQGYGAWVNKAHWEPGKFRATLRKAARQHNTFANHPGNQKNYIQLVTLDGAGQPEAMMGSTIPPRDVLELRVRTNIANFNPRWHFRLFTNQKRTFDAPLMKAGPAATQVVSGGTEQEWRISLDTTGVKFVVVYASPETGAPGASTQYLVSAPIWINNQ